MQCEHILNDVCSNGHTLNWKCFQGRPPVCKRCEKEVKLAEEKRQRDFADKERRDAEEREHARNIAKLEEEYEQQTRLLRDRQLAEERANAIQQKQQDLASITALTAKAPRTSTAASVVPDNGGAPTATANGAASTLPTSADALPAPSIHHSIPPPTPTSTVEQIQQVTTGSEPSSTPTSGAEQEWERQKVMEGASDPSIDAIMSMTGLEAVKKQVLQIKGKVDVTKRQNTSLKNERFNIVLLGNPGTGTSIGIPRPL